MTIQFFSELKISTELTEKQKTGLLRALGAINIGSETSFNFCFTCPDGRRMELYRYACEQFPDRMFVQSDLSKDWVMVSFSIKPSEMDNPTIEKELEGKFQEGLYKIFGEQTKLVKISPFTIEPT